MGGVDYITKPFNPMVVRARVQTHLELKAVRDVLRDDNLRLESRVQARTAELQAVLNRLRESAIDTVLRLGLAAEYKDDDTGRHVLRMSHYAVSVARQLGWNVEDLDRLFHAALMHDIGKIVALTHHEKWDGSGYPRGLRGEDIPLVGRIVAICDVFDALTVRRPYKPAFPLEKAYSILRKSSGSHFDPAVVQAFFAAEADILLTHYRYGDDSPDRPLTPAIIAASIAHPSSPHLLAVDGPSGDDTSAS